MTQEIMSNFETVSLDDLLYDTVTIVSQAADTLDRAFADFGSVTESQRIALSLIGTAVVALRVAEEKSREAIRFTAKASRERPA